jgi:hypothetical protein
MSILDRIGSWVQYKKKKKKKNKKGEKRKRKKAKSSESNDNIGEAQPLLSWDLFFLLHIPLSSFLRR